jgi:hypothetical protein
MLLMVGGKGCSGELVLIWVRPRLAESIGFTFCSQLPSRVKSPLLAHTHTRKRGNDCLFGQLESMVL